jgi:hypothetical protein
MESEYFCPNTRSPESRPRQQAAAASGVVRATVKRARRKYWRRTLEAAAALSQEVCFCPGTLVVSRSESAMLNKAIFATKRPTSKMSHDGTWREACLS